MPGKAKGLFGMAAAFAASPQGRKLIQQARDYATSPEGKRQAKALLEQVRSRAPKRPGAGTPNVPERHP